MRTLLVSILSLILSPSFCLAEKLNIETEDFRLWSSNDEAFTLSSFSDKAAVILIAYPDNCAAQDDILKWYSNIESTLWSKNVTVLWINSRNQQDRTGIKGETTGHFLAPVLMDASQVTSRHMKFQNAGDYVVWRTSDWEKLGSGNWNDGGIEKIFELPIATSKKTAACSLQYRDRSHLTWDLKMATHFQNNCGKCHAKYDYNFFKTDEDVFNWRAMSLLMLRLGKMPEGGFDPATPNCGMNYGRFLDSRELSDLENWLDMGAPHPKHKTNYMTNFYRKWIDEVETKKAALGKPAFFWRTNENEEIPPDGPDLYSTVQVAGPLEEEVKVVAIQNLDSVIRARHHLHIYSIPVPLAELAKTPKGLTSEFRGAPYAQYLKIIFREGVPNRFDNSPVVFKKGSYVIFEAHYHPSGQTEIGRPNFAVYTTNKNLPERHVFVRKTIVPKILPHEKDKVLTGEWRVEEDIRLLQIRAHTHVRGKRYDLRLQKPDGTIEHLCRFQTYQINGFPAFAKPVFVPKGSILRAKYIFDNSAQNPLNVSPEESVKDGSSFSDEMATTRFFYLTESEVKNSPDFVEK